MNTDKHRFFDASSSIARAIRCSGAAVLRLMPSGARVVFIKRCYKKRCVFKKMSLAVLGYRRSTAAPLQRIARAQPNAAPEISTTLIN